MSIGYRNKDAKNLSEDKSTLTSGPATIVKPKRERKEASKKKEKWLRFS